jgi:hypothetical protein
MSALWIYLWGKKVELMIIPLLNANHINLMPLSFVSFACYVCLLIEEIPLLDQFGLLNLQSLFLKLDILRLCNDQILLFMTLKCI